MCSEINRTSQNACYILVAPPEFDSPRLIVWIVFASCSQPTLPCAHGEYKDPASLLLLFLFRFDSSYAPDSTHLKATQQQPSHHDLSVPTTNATTNDRRQQPTQFKTITKVQNVFFSWQPRRSQLQSQRPIAQGQRQG